MNDNECFCTYDEASKGLRERGASSMHARPKRRTVEGHGGMRVKCR